jgi:acyl carrier protein
MAKVTEEAVYNDLLDILNDLTGDWEYSGEISRDTFLLADLDFESIDAVALGTAIEERFQKSLPFAEFLAEVAEREVKDIRVGELSNFIYQNLDSTNTL